MVQAVCRHSTGLVSGRSPCLISEGWRPCADRWQQEFEGWGTSLAWFANIVGRFPDPLRSHLADLLFDAKVGTCCCNVWLQGVEVQRMVFLEPSDEEVAM